MVSGTLHTYSGCQRSFKILITAAYSGADVKVAPDFEFGKTNFSDLFLQKFPAGKVPAFEDSNGHCLNETNAIARYVANEQLLGTNVIDKSLVNEYIEFAENEILPSACTWTFPTLGFRQYNKQDTERAQSHLKKCLALLDKFLLTRTFLVGERVTLADISLAVNLLTLYVQVMDPKFREAFPNVNRWFVTCVNQPNFKKIIGEIQLCDKMATFDNKKYQELHPSQKKAKEAKPKKEEAPKETKPAAPKETPQAAPAPPAKIDYWADAPKISFSFDAWKKQYANEEYDDSLKWFHENFDKENMSVWYLEYQYSQDFQKDFLASNLQDGWKQRMEQNAITKNSFGRIFVEPCCKNKGCFTIKAIWVFRGHKTCFERNPDWCVDSDSFAKKRLDLSKPEDKAFFEKHMRWDDDSICVSQGLV